MKLPEATSSAGLLSRKDKHYSYAPVAYHDSWMTIDPIVGCSLSCEYCYMRATGWTGVEPETLYTIDEVIHLLLSHPLFVSGETVLSFGNQTDPFLPTNVDATWAFVKAVSDRRIGNPVCLVTKKAVPAWFLADGRKLQVPIIFCLSYSGLPAMVEKGVRPGDIRANFE